MATCCLACVAWACVHGGVIVCVCVCACVWRGKYRIVNTTQFHYASLTLLPKENHCKSLIITNAVNCELTASLNTQDTNPTPEIASYQ